jgi:hypothetical protein
MQKCKADGPAVCPEKLVEAMRHAIDARELQLIRGHGLLDRRHPGGLLLASTQQVQYYKT